jgi:hypothetical protein
MAPNLAESQDFHNRGSSTCGQEPALNCLRRKVAGQRESLRIFAAEK